MPSLACSYLMPGCLSEICVACSQLGLPRGLGRSQRKGIQGPVLRTERLEESSRLVCQGKSSGLWLRGSGLGLWLPVHLQLPCVPVSVQRRDMGGPPSAAPLHAGGGVLTHQATHVNAGSYLGGTQAGKGVAASWVLSSAASGKARSFLEADHHGPPVTSPLSVWCLHSDQSVPEPCWWVSTS